MSKANDIGPRQDFAEGTGLVEASAPIYESLSDLLKIPGAGGEEPAAYGRGFADFVNNEAKPNPYDPFDQQQKFAAYAQGWQDARAMKEPLA